MKHLSAFLAAGIAAAPLIATANPYSDLQQAAAAYDSQKAIHADEQFSNGDLVQVDYIPTDRIRVSYPKRNMEDLIIGNAFWVSNRGKWTKLPSFAARIVTSKVAEYRHLLPNVDANSVKDLGMQNVGGKMLHAYSFVSGGAPATMWIDSNHLPQKTITSSKGITTTILYTYGNVSISPP
jgi:hypothetical protein